MSTTHYHAVIFDLDGTLVDSYAALTDAVNHTRLDHGYPPASDEAIRESVGEGLGRLLEQVFPNPVPPTAREVFEQRYDRVCCDLSRLLDGVGTTLDALSRAGLRMAVCTNKPTYFSRKILTHLGVAHHFRAIVGPDLAGARKPDAAHLRYTLRAAGCDAGDSLYVGDMPIDIHAAHNSGMDVAAIATGSSTREALLASTPDFFLEQFSDLIAVARSGELARA